MNTIRILSAMPNEPFLSLGVFSWTVLCLVLCLMSFGLVYCWRRLRTLKDQKAELERQVVERAELLTFATEREKKAQENVTLANQTKQQLLSRINHEIRTPMNGVIGMAALLAETPLSNEQKEYNETIRNCGESLLRVINDILHGDILAYSKVESNRMDIEQKDFELRNSIEEILEVFAGKTSQAELELLYQVDGNIPSHIVGDSQRFRQVLMNIIENAVRHTRRGEIVIKVELVAAAGETLELRFEVRDTGTGIPADKLKVLMNDLSHTNATKAIHQSSGVGLVICQKLVTLMGGSMSIKSTVDQGTSVTFTMPVKASTIRLSAHTQKDMLDLEGKHVLVVDDNLTSRTILKDMLEQWKLVPTIAGSGKQALEIISAASNFDVVLTDMEMPEMDGIKLAQSIRQQHPKLPIILLSKEGDESGKHHPELFSSTVSKPIRQDILSKHIISRIRHQAPSLVEEQNDGHKLSANFAQQYPLRILIAEDNRVNQKLAMKILCKLGYNPDIAQDGKEVLETVSNSKYDLILMDVQMPEMDGLEATRMIRLCLDVQPVIVAMTANSMQGDREECIRAGMDDYISKPVNLEELVIILEKWALVVKEKR
jgi:signal transduction histidine kinase/CheY-like chemotaxis protein